MCSVPAMDTLPVECWLRVLAHVDVATLFALCCTDRTWRDVVCGDDAHWRGALLALFGPDCRLDLFSAVTWQAAARSVREESVVAQRLRVRVAQAHGTRRHHVFASTVLSMGLFDMRRKDLYAFLDAVIRQRGEQLLGGPRLAQGFLVASHWVEMVQNKAVSSVMCGCWSPPHTITGKRTGVVVA